MALGTKQQKKKGIAARIVEAMERPWGAKASDEKSQAQPSGPDKIPLIGLGLEPSSSQTIGSRIVQYDYPADDAPVVSATAAMPTLKQSENPPNLTWGRISVTALFWTGEIWTRHISSQIHRTSVQYPAIFVEIKNNKKEGAAVGSAIGIKAELVVVGDADEEEFVPLPWLDEPCNTVNIEFGASKRLLLAVNRAPSLTAAADWRIVLNHRELSEASSGKHKADFEHFWRQGPDKPLRLNLLQIASGRILQTFHGRCEWKAGDLHPDIVFALV